MQLNRDIVYYMTRKCQQDLDKFKLPELHYSFGEPQGTLVEEKAEVEIDIRQPPPKLTRGQVITYRAMVDQARITGILGGVRNGR